MTGLDQFLEATKEMPKLAEAAQKEIEELRQVRQTVREGFFPTAHRDVPPDPNQRQYRINVIYRILASRWNSGEREPVSKREIYAEVLKLIAQDNKGRRYEAPKDTTVFRDLNYSASRDWEGFRTDPFYMRGDKILPATICKRAGYYSVNFALLDTISLGKITGANI